MKITIFNTATQRPATIENFTGSNWGQLQRELAQRGISYSNMSVTVKETKVTLESDQAVLPTSDFTIFLFPKQVKSGMTPSDLSDQMAEFETNILKQMQQSEARILQALKNVNTPSYISSAPVRDSDADAARRLAEEARQLQGSMNQYRGW